MDIIHFLKFINLQHWCVIRYFVIVIGIWFFDSIILFVITLTGDEMDCGSNNDDETK